MKEDSVLHKASEEAKREKAMLKEKSFGQKIQYFFMYYKIPVIIIAVIVIAVISIFYSKAHNKDYAFQALLLNSQDSFYGESLDEEFGELIDIDSSKYEVVIDSSLSIDGTSQLSVGSTEKVMAEISTGLVDICVMPEELFDTYLDENAFGDLSDYLDDEHMAEYADLIYYDGDTPVGIRMNDAAKIKDVSLYEEDDAPILGIVYNTQHPEECLTFLDYLFAN